MCKTIIQLMSALPQSHSVNWAFDATYNRGEHL